MTPGRRFLYRLALESGYWAYNPYALFRRMPLYVWLEWQEFAILEPFGAQRRDVRAGTIAAMVLNATTRSKKSDPVLTAADIFPELAEAHGARERGTGRRRRGRVLTPDEQFVKVFWINRLLGGQFIDKRKRE